MVTKKALSVVFLLSGSMASGQEAWRVPLKIERQVMQAIKAQLKDPDSAKFRDLLSYAASDKTRHICGLVNAKNTYGGYVGATAFYVVYAGGQVAYSKIDMGDELGSGRALKLCEPAQIEKYIAQAKEDERIEKTALCSIDSTESSPGLCGELMKKCKSYLRYLAGPSEHYEFSKHCRIYGYESAAEKWYLPKPAVAVQQ